MTDFRERVNEIVEDYLHAFQIPYSELAELDSVERQDLLTTLMEELSIAITPEDLDELVEKEDLNLTDIVNSFEAGEPIDDEF